MSNSVVQDLWFSIPRFAKGTCLDKPSLVSAALATETADPLPSPPRPSQFNAEARATIQSHPSLFKIVTPIKVDVFEAYLRNHPNKAYVASVCCGLREGFWPWASVDDPNMWKQCDNSYRPITKPEHVDFVQEQKQEEIRLGRWSEPFGSHLLPGMHSSPIHAAPKSEPGKFRLIVDHSQDPYSLNSMILGPEPKFPLDTIADFVHVILRARDKHGKKKLVLWKSDVKSAYRLMPMHPLWQIRQIITVDGQRYVDRCNEFGSRAGGWVWASFISLVLWIAIKVKGIEDLLGYVDDHFSWDFYDNEAFYRPYRKFLPRKQVQYLELWDELGIPHEEEKQLFGSPLAVIGFEVDPETVRVRLPDSRRDELFRSIDDFVRKERRSGTRLEFQELAGTIEWALKVNPYGRPGLSGLHEAIGASWSLPSNGMILVTERIRRELKWLKDHIKGKDGLRLEWTKPWKEDPGSLIHYADASPSGLGLYIPALMQGFHTKAEQFRAIRDEDILNLESFAILSMLECSRRLFHPTRLVIFSDNTSSVDMYESLNTQDELRNRMLMAYVDNLSRCLCRVFHVLGKENEVADKLSRLENPGLRGLTIRPFEMIHLALMLEKLGI